jgi:hypothetical protein
MKTPAAIYVEAGKPNWELEVAARDGRLEDEGWRLRKDGTRFWANVVITALRDEGGRLVGFAKVTPGVELAYLWAYFVFAVVVYFRWAYLVVTSICNFLGINALTIPREKQIANQKALEVAKKGQ